MTPNSMVGSLFTRTMSMVLNVSVISVAQIQPSERTAFPQRGSEKYWPMVKDLSRSLCPLPARVRHHDAGATQPAICEWFQILTTTRRGDPMLLANRKDPITVQYGEACAPQPQRELLRHEHVRLKVRILRGKLCSFDSSPGRSLRSSF